MAKLISAIREQTLIRVADLESKGFPAPDVLMPGEVAQINRDFITALDRAFNSRLIGSR